MPGYITIHSDGIYLVTCNINSNDITAVHFGMFAYSHVGVATTTIAQGSFGANVAVEVFGGKNDRMWWEMDFESAVEFPAWNVRMTVDWRAPAVYTPGSG